MFPVEPTERSHHPAGTRLQCRSCNAIVLATDVEYTSSIDPRWVTGSCPRCGRGVHREGRTFDVIRRRE